ncbi:uncharacterized protein GLRG_10569 [Colletotrichum graminicola M1.001]|uniref:Uncharacterized protein n=1 Tax=Colletotrichum graminicola (strain M1.001 / M2 / FGSC 10212) TaxID=645133 RepID=E3QX37_COLGM|nr:uncharacterized protein GLRG_10569 [Colletotrichum graminicola M1.001]EFQ35425.1 hypothetical protein GLRG_10569 [Colletotrichum graminicola M1.001]
MKPEFTEPPDLEVKVRKEEDAGAGQLRPGVAWCIEADLDLGGVADTKLATIADWEARWATVKKPKPAPKTKSREPKVLKVTENTPCGFPGSTYTTCNE